MGRTGENTILRFQIVNYIIKSRSEPFCGKAKEIEDRDKVEVGHWAKHKKTFYSE
jgi:hypothetical protein